MQISQLVASNAFSATDVLAIEINNVTYKLTGATLASALQSIGLYSTESELSDSYDNTATYAVGDYCIYGNTLYKCNTAITTAEEWNAAHWTATNVADELQGCLKPSDVVNNLSSTATDKPLAPAAINTLWGDHLSGLHVYHYSSGSINISANADKDIDFSSAIPQGVSAPWAVLAWISSGGTYYSLPYINNSGVPQTWVYGTIGGTKLRIHSTVAWSNSTVYLVLITF